MRHFLAALLLAAAVPTQTFAQDRAAARPTTDSARVGSYDLELAMIDGTMTGELTIKREGARLTASVKAGANEPAVKSFGREGDEYVLVGGHGNFTVTYRFTFAKDSVKGSFKLSTGVEGRVIGALRR
jgi:hypothetical protein